MGIEAIGSIGTAMGSVAPALASFGEVMKAPLGNIVNKGPVKGGFVEGFRPMNITDITTIDPGGTVAPLGEILFQTKPQINETTGTIARVENFLAQARMPRVEPMIIPEIAPMESSMIAPRLPSWEVMVPLEAAPVARTVIKQAEEVAQKAWDSHVLTQTEQLVSNLTEKTPVVLSQPAQQEQEVEEVVTQKVEEEDIEGEEDEVAMKKKIHLVDKPVLATVLSETSEAIEKAKEEAERLGLGRRIIGSIVAKLLPTQHEGNTGGAVKPHGVDGTIIARREAIAGKQEFSSEKEVVEVVFENRPVTIGEDGDPSTQKEVDTTYLGWVVKPPKVIQIVEIRRKKMVGKRAQVPARQETTLPPRETNLEELNPALAEVFPKAA